MNLVEMMKIKRATDARRWSDARPKAPVYRAWEMEKEGSRLGPFRGWKGVKGWKISLTDAPEGHLYDVKEHCGLVPAARDNHEQLENEHKETNPELDDLLGFKSVLRTWRDHNPVTEAQDLTLRLREEFPELKKDRSLFPPGMIYLAICLLNEETSNNPTTHKRKGQVVRSNIRRELMRIAKENPTHYHRLTAWERPNDNPNG